MNLKHNSSAKFLKPFLASSSTHETALTSFRQDLLRKVEEEEAEESVVYHVREELMAKVMDEIYEKYIQKQTIRFMVHCTYKALVKIIDWEFFYHMELKPYYVGHPAWSPDEPAPPSHPDSFAAFRVPERVITPPEINIQTGPSGDYSLPDEPEEVKSFAKSLEMIFETDSPEESMIASGLGTPQSSDFQDLCQEEFVPVEESVESAKASSIFTKLVRGDDVQECTKNEHLEIWHSAPKLPRIQMSMTNKLALPQVSRIENLPPIRVNAVLKANPPPVDDVKSKKKKRNK